MNLAQQMRKPGSTGDTAAQSAAHYYARKRRRARERAGAAEFNVRSPQRVGVLMTVTLKVG